MALVVIVMAVLFVAYTNGANDNFKGVATLFGSGACTYRQALVWATVTTLAGSLLALYLAGGLVKAFSGSGLVPDAVTHQTAFLLAVSLGAALTVLLATATGLPVSTTHALTGGLVGAGLLAAAGDVHFDALGMKFVVPASAQSPDRRPWYDCGLSAVPPDPPRRRRHQPDLRMCRQDLRDGASSSRTAGCCWFARAPLLEVAEAPACVQPLPGARAWACKRCRCWTGCTT